MQETRVRSLGREDPLEEMAPHSSTLAWRVPWTEEASSLWSAGSRRVGHDGSCFARLHTHPPELNVIDLFPARCLAHTPKCLLLGGWVFVFHAPSGACDSACFVAVFRNCSLDKEMKGYREPGEGPGTRRTRRSEEQARSQELRAGSGASETEARRFRMRL